MNNAFLSLPQASFIKGLFNQISLNFFLTRHDESAQLPLLDPKVISYVAVSAGALDTVTDSSEPQTGRALMAAATIVSLAAVVSGSV